MEKMKNLCTINMDLMPIKLHYFFFYGGMGGVVPYMPVVAKSLGINAIAVGIVFTVIPFFVLFSKPIFGYLTDYFRNIKTIVFILVLITCASFLSVLLIPSVHTIVSHLIPVHLNCSDGKLFLYPLKYDENCMVEKLKEGVRFQLKYRECDDNTSTTVSGRLEMVQHESTEIVPENGSQCVSNVDFSRFYTDVEPDGNFTCSCVANNSSFVTNSVPNISSCLCLKEDENTSVYRTYQFWIFTLLAVISGIGSNVVFTLSDAACYEVLGDRPKHYGRQRLWATVSWGIVTLSAGFLNDLATGTSDQKNFSPGFYIMLVCILVDLLLLIKIHLTKANFSINICQDIGKIFSCFDTVVFAFAVYIVGALSGLIWSYEFWYLQDLGATQTLLGLAVAVQCLAVEVPFLFFSGWFIKSFGYFFCLSGSLAAFTLRFGFYYLLENPWFVLPIELLHGLTFAIFYACMTGYSSSNAPPGTEATMLGILGGLYEGLGVATGSMLGGVGFDKMGGRYTFLVAGVISFICVPLLLVYHILSKKPNCGQLCNKRMTPKETHHRQVSEHKM